MKTILVIVLVGAALIWVMRIMRRRELDKFRDADAGLLAEMKSDLGIADETPPASSVISGLSPKVASLAADQPVDLVAPVLKSIILTERERRVLDLLEGVLPARYRVFVNLGLSDLMTTHSTQRVSFVICDSQYLTLEAALEFFDQVHETLTEHFMSAGKPLISVSEMESEVTIKEELLAAGIGLVDLLDQKQRCPKCYGGMKLKAPKTGKNAGKRFWLCDTYPRCRGVQTL